MFNQTVATQCPADLLEVNRQEQPLYKQYEQPGTVDSHQGLYMYLKNAMNPRVSFKIELHLRFPLNPPSRQRCH